MGLSFSTKLINRQYTRLTIILTLCVVVFFSREAKAQLTTVRSGGSVKATVQERIGLTEVTINYSRPSVKGREGKIWGDLISEGFGPDTSNPTPWRAGANENTTIEFSTDVIIEGVSVPAGKYGLFIAYYPSESVLILSKNSNSWGNIFYSAKEDFTRIKIKPVSLDKSIDRLTYEFSEQDDSSAVVALKWEKLSLPFHIKIELIKLQLVSFDNELRTERGFTAQSWLQVADYMLEHKVRLDEGLKFATNAANVAPSFRSYIVSAEIQSLLGLQNEAKASEEKAVYFGNTNQIHYYALGQLNQKEYARSLRLLQLNYKRNPDLFITNIGLAKYYSAINEPSNVKRYASSALKHATNEAQRNEASALVKR